MTLTSNWPHPGFMGDYLPVKHKISETGFQANWQSSWFANNMESWFSEQSPEWAASRLSASRLPRLPISTN
jgi:inner membrane protein